ncbi:MAG TPA: hypothetical protein VJ907_05870 [Halanaerobiales bacterium]|nr:hypothetical protein [Halanaerobiales bacterium]
MYKVEIKSTNNADKFRPAAIEYDKTGRYTAAPKGTKEYRDYWKEQLERCIHGYVTDDGEFITGYFYFYLNFCRINVTKRRKYKDRLGREREKEDRIESFPWFYDYDRSYFDTIEEAETQGRHLAVLKKRGAGYSFKGAAMLIRNYYCLPKSKSYAIASEMEFLVKDGLITKAWEMMSFIDEHTGLGKKRQKIDQSTHKRASLIKKAGDGTELEIGYRSEIMAISLKNDPQKARGKRGKLILWEEAGKFPNLKTAWQIARPSVENDDGSAYGLMIAFGTGGEEGSDYDGLKDIFYEPKGYNALEIENIWDDGNPDKPCGFFVPQYVNMATPKDYSIPLMDENGNSNIAEAKKYSLEKRQEIVDNASDRNAVDRYIAERPFNPMEASLEISGNIFPKKALMSHLAEIRNSKSISDFKQVGYLEWTSEGRLRWELDPNLRALNRYRLEPGDDKTGAIVIWEHPDEDPQHGLYIAGVDPYDHDKSTTNSLGSCFIYKRFQTYEKYHDMIVAEYTGRPDRADDFYEMVRKLTTYYNATILYENEKKGMFDYFRRKHCEFLLADQPGLIKDIVRDSKVERAKGIHMNEQIKMFGEGAIRDYLIEEFAPGQTNILKIYSEPLLEELINYNDTGNFDRVMAFMMVIIYNRELFNVHIKQKKEESRENMLFSTPLFTDKF